VRPGTPGKLLQALFDGLRKSNGQHNYLAIQVDHNVHRETRTTLRTLIDKTRLLGSGLSQRKVERKHTKAIDCIDRADSAAIVKIVGACVTVDDYLSVLHIGKQWSGIEIKILGYKFWNPDKPHL